ncbi:MAG: hypothetical protein IRZ00_11730 [Gemmatimonadetes bacterium]|nr:hypothetical protein [Gemmatimonadota bacterium]
MRASFAIAAFGAALAAAPLAHGSRPGAAPLGTVPAPPGAAPYDALRGGTWIAAGARGPGDGEPRATPHASPAVGRAPAGTGRDGPGAAGPDSSVVAGSGARQARALTFTSAIFLPGTARLTAAAAVRLRDLGRELRDAGAPSVDIRVVEGPGVDEGGIPLATHRAAAVAAGLVRGGYPRTRLTLEVVPAVPGAIPGTVSLRPAPGDGVPLTASSEPVSRLR